MKKGKDAIEVFLDNGIDIPGRTIYLKGAIDEDTLDVVTSGFHLLPKDSDVLIILNSPGGDVGSGLAIYDLIKAHKGEVTIRVVGEACSMGAIILQAGDIREATSNSTIMHHIGGSSSGYDHAKNSELAMEFYKTMQDRMNAILLEQINERRSEQGKEPRSKAWMKEHNMWDRWLWPEEAIEMGLLDRIWRG